MKDIKDYLHLYLGCDCKWKLLGDDGWSEDRWRTGVIDLKVLDRIYDRQPFEVRLILRPLSDMTDEEQCDLQLLKDQLEEDDAHNSEIEVFAALGNACRKLHIDIDGLIEAGLAIDKTKLNPQQ